MNPKRWLLAFAILHVVVLASSCGDDDGGGATGACVFNGSCSNNSTAGECAFVSGTFYEGQTCNGAVTAAAASPLVLSEVYLLQGTAPADIGWVELWNSGDMPIDLSGFSLVFSGKDRDRTVIALNGVVRGCSTFVVGRAEADAGFGFPDYDQKVDLRVRQAARSSSQTVIALVRSADVWTVSAPLSAVAFEFGADDVAFVPTVTDAAPRAGKARPGYSFERIDRSGSEWMARENPEPHKVASGLGCGPQARAAQDWDPIRVLY